MRRTSAQTADPSIPSAIPFVAYDSMLCEIPEYFASVVPMDGVNTKQAIRPLFQGNIVGEILDANANLPWRDMTQYSLNHRAGTGCHNVHKPPCVTVDGTIHGESKVRGKSMPRWARARRYNCVKPLYLQSTPCQNCFV